MSANRNVPVGYPSVQGLTILRFLSYLPNIQRLKAKLPNLYVPSATQARSIASLASQISKAALDNIIPLDGEEHNPNNTSEKWIHVFPPESVIEHRNIDYHAEPEQDFTRWLKVLVDPCDPTREPPADLAWANWTTKFHDAYFPLSRNCPSLAPETGAGILALVAESAGRLPVRSDENMVDVVDWVYVIDLDRDLLEVYERLRPKLGMGRFAKGSGGPGLVKRWRIDELPDENGLLEDVDAAMDCCHPNDAGATIFRFLQDAVSVYKLEQNLSMLAVVDKDKYEEQCEKAAHVHKAWKILCHYELNDGSETQDGSRRTKPEDVPMQWSPLNIYEMKLLEAQTESKPDLDPDEMARALLLTCPSLSDKTGVGILEIVARATETVPVVHDLDMIDFPALTWAYVIDFDTGMFEVYKGAGGVETNLAVNRFDDSIYPPKKMGGWRLENLPNEEATLGANEQETDSSRGSWRRRLASVASLQDMGVAAEDRQIRRRKTLRKLIDAGHRRHYERLDESVAMSGGSGASPRV
ncbi:60S ribosomal protein L3-B [Sphaceloma murrayae]|uniref:60S ribosomal protein L3-B n=1 Tax=Sphaceloma murrayae TaxID=2082308 RepID=A0A2K1QH49_9PEZI|nr:60S ribosomal protein L3-B [Sphaceloma murrayae]